MTYDQRPVRFVHVPSDAELTERATALTDAIQRSLVGKLLLTHPFYQRWEAGDLELDELGRYAVQYRVFEAALPGILESLAAGLEAEGAVVAGTMIRQNLADELTSPEPHLVLFDRFAESLPSPSSEVVGPAALDLVETYEELLEDGPISALAALAAYELQAAAIASTKATGLRERYGISDRGTQFWDVHAAMEAGHGDWAVMALAQAAADPSHVEGASSRGADAWWKFLNERQADADGDVLALAG